MITIFGIDNLLYFTDRYLQILSSLFLININFSPCLVFSNILRVMLLVKNPSLFFCKLSIKHYVFCNQILVLWKTVLSIFKKILIGKLKIVK